MLAADLGGEVSFERLVDGDAVYVGVVHEPNHLIAEQLALQHAIAQYTTKKHKHMQRESYGRSLARF